MPPPSGFQAYSASVLPVLGLRDAFLFVVSGALATHLLYKKYEIPLTRYIPTLLLLVAIPALCSSFLVPHFAFAVLAYAVGFSTFYAALLASIAVYRLSPWHPLAKYPGPALARLSKLWTVAIFLRGDYKCVVLDLHRKYGPYVRTGPNEVSFVDVDLLPAILAPDMPKGPAWDGRSNPDVPPPVVATRSSKDHAQKRVLWSHALSSASVREYQPVISRRGLQLAEELEKRARVGESLNLVEWLSRFAFDFMGDMAFGGGFELMRDGDVHGIWEQMEARNDGIAWQMHLPWASRLLIRIPHLSGTIVKFRKFTVQCAAQRQKNGSTVKDLFYHLINEANERTVKRMPDLDEIVSNGETAIIAGSDTTSTTLSGLFYYLISHPECYARLQREVDAEFPPGEGDPFDAARLAEMKYLNAAINEAMRLQPALPSYIHRSPEKGTGGKWIGEHFISEATAVNVSPYVLHRDPRYFSPNPDEFWPERWLQGQTSGPLSKGGTPQPVITNTAAFIPFSAGNRNCAGKNLAISEMRAVVALLMQRFEMRFADGYDPGLYEEGVVDKFITKVGELRVVLKPRA